MSIKSTEYANSTAVHLAIHYISKNTPSTTDTENNPTKGNIICTASNAGLYAFPMAPIYSATKHAVIGLVRSLARGLEKEQIRINALAPAVIGEFNFILSIIYFFFFF